MMRGRPAWPRIGAAFALAACLLAPAVRRADAAPAAEPWNFWAANDPASTVRIDHGQWDRFLKKYVVASDPSGINRVRYSAVTPEDRQKLEEYLGRLQRVQVTRLSRGEQKAYWIDLYNALTVKVVLDHYPIESIRDINISPGFFSVGPWGAKALSIQGQKVSLNDIEHRILRPLWRDERVHYAVNCASLGCPNLRPEAFTAKNSDALLEKGAPEYVNHPRGAQTSEGRLFLSGIYDWFREDFGGTGESVLRHLRTYAAPALAERLKDFQGRISCRYDWRLNAPPDTVRP